MHALVGKFGKQFKAMEFFFALEAHIFLVHVSSSGIQNLKEEAPGRKPTKILKSYRLPSKFTRLPIHLYYNIDRFRTILSCKWALTSGDFKPMEKMLRADLTDNFP